jgi:type IV pilus assembly protein PilM
MGLFIKNTDFIGLDIGSTAIRLVQLRPGAKPSLMAYASVPVEGNITISDAAGDQDKVAALIKQLLVENKIMAKDVVVGLPSNKVFATVIRTPNIDRKQLGKAISLQAEQFVPMAISQVKLDWAVLNETPDGKSLDVLLISAPNSIVEKYVSIVEKAGLEALALEANAVAVTRSLLPAGAPACVVLDLGSLDSDVTVVWKNVPMLMRSIEVGGLTVVRTVSKTLGLDEAQATQFTYKFGLTQSKLEGQVYRAVKPVLDGLVAEVVKSIKFFNSRYPDVTLEKLVVTGGPSMMPELGIYLANSLGMPVEFGNAWTNVSYPAELQDKLMSLSSQYATAVGLAGRGYIA